MSIASLLTGASNADSGGAGTDVFCSLVDVSCATACLKISQMIREQRRDDGW